MRLNEMIGVLLYFDALNGGRQITSNDAVPELVAEYRNSWAKGFELSHLFDSSHYAGQLNPKELTEYSPLEHYLLQIKPGADPHPLFDEAFYSERYSELSGGAPAIVDYAAAYVKGHRATRVPSPYFDPGYYLTRNGDVARSSTDPLSHFLRFGAKEGRAFHPFLDLKYVEKQLSTDNAPGYPTDRLALLRFLIAFNVLDRVDPSPFFSNQIYRESKVDRIERNPFYDFLRQTDPYRAGDPVGTFSVRRYVDDNPAVNFRFTNPYSHYLTYASKETETCDLISWSSYLEVNNDVAERRIQPLEHLIAHAATEGRFVSKAHRESFLGRCLQLSGGIRPIPKADASPEQLILRRADSPFESTCLVSIPLLRAASLEVVTIDFWDTLVLRESPHWTPKLHTAKTIKALLERALQATYPASPSRPPATESGLHARVERSTPKSNAQQTPEQDLASVDDIYRQRIAIESGLFAEGIEYDFKTVMRRQLQRLSVTYKLKALEADVDRVIAELLVEEQSFEAKHVTLNRELYQLVEARVRRGDQVAVVSDYYHDSEYLRAILSSIGVSPGIYEKLKIFSSCEAGVSKLAQGALFDHVATALGILERSGWIHIGDSEQSDVRAAHSKQISTIHFKSATGSKRFQVPEPSSQQPDKYHEAIFRHFDESVRQSCVTPIATTSTERQHDLAAPLIRQAAQEYAAIPTLLVMAAIERATSLGIDHVIYLSREGVFLKEIHDRLRHTLAPAQSAIAPIHLQTSRRSLFAPTFAVNERQAIAIFESQYPNASLRTLVKALLPADALSAIPATLLDSLSDTTVSEYAKAVAMGRQCHTEVFEQCRRHALQQQRLLQQYWRQKKVFQNGWRQAVICDIGWRGTMQDMLAVQLPHVHTVGVYLGLFPFHLEQPENTIKIGLAFDANRGEAFSHVDPPAALERTWTPNVGSAISYARASDGAVGVIQDVSDCTPQAEQNIGAFQQEVLCAVPLIADEYVRYGLTADSVRCGLAERLQAYYKRPHPGIAELWFSSLHDDTFGSGENPYKKQLPAINQVSTTNLRYLVEVHGANSRWKEGYRSWPSVQWYEALLGE